MLLPVKPGVELPLKAKHVLEATVSVGQKYLLDKRWDVITEALRLLEKDLWHQFKQLDGNKVVLNDHYQLSSYCTEDDKRLHFILSIRVGILDI